MSADSSMMRRRLRLRSEKETLALEDQPNGSSGAREEVDNGAEPELALVGQELIPVDQVEKADEEGLPFQTPLRQQGESSLVMAQREQFRLPEGAPLSFAPPPLFSPQQLSMLDEMYKRHSSPLLPRSLPALPLVGGHGYAGMTRTEEDPRRMAREMLRPEPPLEPPQPQRFQIGTRPPSEEPGHGGGAGVEDQMWKLRVGKELREMSERLSLADQENRALKEEMALIRMFYTPESEKAKTRGATTEAPGVSAGVGGTEREKVEPNQMDLILLMMQNMQELQKHMMSRDDVGAQNGVEVVRSGALDLPKLAEWDSQEGPLKMGDWLALLEPAISDLSTTSEVWWGEMVTQV